MSNKSGFWGWHQYAKANDDIRNKVVEEGWFGQKTQDNSFQQDVNAMEARAGQDIHGNSAQPPHNPDTDPNAALYGQAQPENDMDAFYGRDDPESDPRQALYGPEPEPEPEQEP